MRLSAYHKPSLQAKLNGLTLVYGERKPGAINKHIIAKCNDDTTDYELHATKGWRQRARKKD